MQPAERPRPPCAAASGARGPLKDRRGSARAPEMPRHGTKLSESVKAGPRHVITVSDTDSGTGGGECRDTCLKFSGENPNFRNSTMLGKSFPYFRVAKGQTTILLVAFIALHTIIDVDALASSHTAASALSSTRLSAISSSPVPSSVPLTSWTFTCRLRGGGRRKGTKQREVSESSSETCVFSS